MITMQFWIITFFALIGSVMAKEFDSVTATTPEMISHYDYPVESHRVTTEDGYILTMHRIPGSPSNPTAKNKPVVFLMHGFLLSSFDWVLTGPDKAFAFILADAGYDVWMGNARGNVYSRDHVNKTDLTEEEYWRFSWHEIGYYDLPAMVDYTLESTGQKKIFYIGFSQGTTTFYVLTSMRTEYNDKFEVMISLGPAAFLEHLSSPPLVIAGQFTYSLEVFSQLFGINEIKPSDKIVSWAGKIFCNDKTLTQYVCSNFLFLLYGFDQKQLNNTILPTIVGHFPAGSSIGQFFHYAQEFKSGKFRRFDHGLNENLKVYGSPIPPDYNLSAIRTPMHLYYGANDFLADPTDVKHLYSELRNEVQLHRVDFDKWNHIDFLYANDAPKLLYGPILNTMKKLYNN